MKVKEIMTRDARSCAPETSVREAAATMREADCGALPVVHKGKTSGMSTDRDICLALAERNRLPSDLQVEEAMSRALYACAKEDGVEKALATMRGHQVRRLPVVDGNGVLRGIVSLNDVALHAVEKGDGHAIAYGEAMKTFKAICGHRHAAPPTPKGRPAARAQSRVQP